MHLPGARATAALTVTPSTGIPGTQVVLTAPAGTFGNSVAVNVTFADSHSSLVSATSTSGSDGSLNISFTVPTQLGGNTPYPGAATITVTDSTNSSKVATGTFTIKPQVLSVSPGQGNPGTQVTVTGSGFTPNGAVTFSIGGASAGNGTASGNGSIAATITVPQIGNGVTTVTASDVSTGAPSTAAAFTVTGSSANTPTATTTPPTATTTATVVNGGLTITPNNGPPGTTSVTVSAPAGTFQGNTAAIVTFSDPNGSNPTVQLSGNNVVTNSDGSLSTSVTIPGKASFGNATITVIAGGASKFGIFKINPTLTASPTTVPQGGTITLTGSGFTANKQITFALSLATIQATGTVTSDAFGSFTATIVIPAGAQTGAAFLTANDGNGGQGVASFTIGVPATSTGTATQSPTATATGTTSPTGTPPTATPVNTPIGQTNATNDYFAEGYTGLAATNGKATYTEVLNILNPGGTTATVTITYYVQGAAAPQTVSRQVAAGTVLREAVNADVGSDRFVAAVVTSPQHLMVSRTITRVSASGTRLDGSTTQPVGAPATNWGFAEGYTGITFQEYLTLLNTNNAPASVQVVLAPQAASAAGARVLTISVPALGRATANIRALNLGNSANSVGMLISSTLPIVAERVEYFGDGVGSGKFGSTVTRGMASGGTELRIPYAVSGGSALDVKGHLQPVGDQGYVTLLNPSSSITIHVVVSFADSAGHALAQPTAVDVPPGTRRTVIANVALGTSPVGPVSVAISSSGPVMAELAQYYGGSPNIGQHPGVALPALTGATTDAFLSELSTAQIDSVPVKRTVYLYNPGGSPVQVTATYFGATGTTAQASYSVPSNGIVAVNVNQDSQSSVPVGPLGAEFRLANGSTGSFIAAGIGLTTDSLSATEDIGAALP